MRNTDAGVRVGWAVIPARAASIGLLWLLTGLFAFAAEAVELPPFGSQEYLILGIVLLLAFAALGFGVYLLRWTLAQDPGTPKMQEVARAIQDGANAYLKRQISTMIWFALAITAILFLLYRPVYERVYPGEGLLFALLRRGVPHPAERSIRGMHKFNQIGA
jgi:hypothetical protein